MGVGRILTAMERGDLNDWRRIARAIGRDPFGKVAKDLAVAIELTEWESVAMLMASVLATAQGGEKEAVARQLRADVRRTGLSQKEFAGLLGTSPARLSTYLKGTVTPSAVLALRAKQIGERHSI